MCTFLPLLSNCFILQSCTWSFVMYLYVSTKSLIKTTHLACFLLLTTKKKQLISQLWHSIWLMRYLTKKKGWYFLEFFHSWTNKTKIYLIITCNNELQNMEYSMLKFKIFKQEFFLRFQWIHRTYASIKQI